MNEAETPQQSEGQTLEEAFQEAESEPETLASTEQTPTETTTKTDAEKWRDYLSQFPDPETARKAVKDYAAKTGMAIGSGYRAVKQIKKFKSNMQRPSIATFHIKEVDVPAPAPSEQDQPPIFTQETPAYQPLPQQPSYTPPMQADNYEELKGVIERQSAKAINNCFEMLAPKIGLAGNGEKFLEDDDAKDLGIILPLILKKVSGGNMTPEMTENVAIGSFAAALVTKGLKNRMANKPQQPQPTPTPTPQPTEQPAPTEQPRIENTNQDTKPAWAKALR